jgi:signal transduction histidine kinase
MSRKDERPERKHTDESLAVERAKADLALNQEKAAIEKKADVVIERARDEADDVLSAARAKEDEKHDAPVSPEPSRHARTEARNLEDQRLDEERGKADETLRRERAASARLFARLLPLDREKTDQYLLTERARSDDALTNRDDFLGMVSHDLRDLLNGIVLNSVFIADNSPPDEQGKRTLAASQRVQRSAGRMARLIGDLVDVASIDAGKLAVVPDEGDGAAWMLEAVETWAPPAAAKGVALEAGARGPLPARGDGERILQVLGNLITNAVKFTPKGGTIIVTVEGSREGALFSVIDTGVGIPGDKLEAIFERFWQIGTNDRRGLGLGLYISRCLIEAHGGRIWAESELGVGSTLRFTLPAR